MKNKLLSLLVAIALLLTVFPQMVSAGGLQCTPVYQPTYIPNNVLDVARKDPRFSTFVQAAEIANLQDLLTVQNGFTVFIPTNDAFAKVPTDALNALLANPGNLRQYLLYHILQDTYKSTELPFGQNRTALGKDFVLAQQGGGVVINNTAGTVANVVAPIDVMADNGVIHAIDMVLDPPGGVFTSRDRPPAPPAPNPCESNFHKFDAGRYAAQELIDEAAVLAYSEGKVNLYGGGMISAETAQTLATMLDTVGLYGEVMVGETPVSFAYLMENPLERFALFNTLDSEPVVTLR